MLPLHDILHRTGLAMSLAVLLGLAAGCKQDFVDPEKPKAPGDVYMSAAVSIRGVAGTINTSADFEDRVKTVRLIIATPTAEPSSTIRCTPSGISPVSPKDRPPCGANPSKSPKGSATSSSLPTNTTGTSTCPWPRWSIAASFSLTTRLPTSPSPPATDPRKPSPCS